jgi:hypothetical protein
MRLLISGTITRPGHEKVGKHPMTTASLVFSHNNGSTSQGIIGGIEQAPVEGATPARTPPRKCGPHATMLI